jgi:hypothetical protein
MYFERGTDLKDSTENELISKVNEPTPIGPDAKPENPFVNLIVNIIIPVFVLNKMSESLGPVKALVVALAFPIAYGIYDGLKRKKVNVFSVLGVLNVAITGGFALANISGYWFAVKEAAFPALIGIFVLGSAFTKKPFVRAMIFNPQVMKVDLIQQRLKDVNQETDFYKLLKTSTVFLAFSFFISSLLNFVLAIRIFKPLDPNLDEAARGVTLNAQIAEMTSLSFAVIMIPSMIILALILWHLIRGLKSLTGMNFEDLMKS